MFCSPRMLRKSLDSRAQVAFEIVSFELFMLQIFYKSFMQICNVQAVVTQT